MSISSIKLRWFFVGKFKTSRSHSDINQHLPKFNSPAVITHRSEIRAPPHDILLLKNDCLITATCLNLEKLKLRKHFPIKKLLDL